MTRFRLLLALTVGCLGLAGVAALALSGSSAANDGVLSVRLADDAIELESETASPGGQVIEARNAGTTEHELVVVETGRAPDALPVGLHGVSVGLAGELVVGEDHEALGHGHGPGEVLGLLPGESIRHQVDLAPGRYVVFCQTDAHYLRGEHAALSVR